MAAPGRWLLVTLFLIFFAAISLGASKDNEEDDNDYHYLYTYEDDDDFLDVVRLNDITCT